MNPMAITVGSMHDIFVNNQAPQWIPLLNVSLVGFLLMILGLYLFRRHSGDMVDEL